MSLGIECVLRYKSFPRAVELWSRLIATHTTAAQATTGSNLARARSSSFSIDLDAGQISFCPVANHRLDRLELVDVVASIEDADLWLSNLVGDARFIQARVYDKEFDYWQNASDRLQYEAAGRSYAGLPMISNGLPYPMAQDIIDTSRNPGRSVLRSGFIESVGSVMWLGDGFWEIAQISAPDWSVLPWLEVEKHRGFVRLRASTRPFTSADGDERERQDALRSLIFGRSG